jgi:hypothetical protein
VRKESPPTILQLLGLAFGLGISLISLGTFYLAYGQIQLRSSTIALFLAALCLGLVGLNLLAGKRRLWKRHRHKEAESPFSKVELPEGPNLERDPLLIGSPAIRATYLEITMLSMIGAAVLIVLLDALSQPLLSFDARAIWGMKAQVIFSCQQIYGEDFFDPDRLHAKQRYPLGIPLAQSFMYHMIGHLDDRLGKIIFPGFFVALCLSFYAALRHFFSRCYSLLGTFLLAILPAFSIYANGGAASGYADVPLTYFYTVFALSLFNWLWERRDSDLVLALVFGVFAVFTKNEGLALWGITVLCLALVGKSAGQPFSRNLGSLLFLAIASAVALLPWYLYRSRLPLLEEDYFRLLTPAHLMAGIHRLPYLLKSFVREIFLRPQLWSLLGPCLLLAFCASPSRAIRQRHGVFLWIALLYCVFLVMIYLVIPWTMEELIPVSLTRLLMPLTPILILWMLFQMQATSLLPERWTTPEPR